MKRVLLICHLDDSKTSGQQAKTLDVIEQLLFKGYRVDVFNYGEMSFLKMIVSFRKRIKNADIVIIMPGGRRALSFYCHLLRKYANKKDIHYLAVGGWVIDFYFESRNNNVFRFLKEIKGVYLQNNESASLFRKEGFSNCFCVPTFSSRKILTNDEFEISKANIKKTDEFRFCYFARIAENKGILLACNAIISLAKKLHGYKINLDIFGEFQNDSIREKVFELLNANKCLHYQGVLNGKSVIKTLSSYYAMLFPTYYPGEGTPHTVVESFMAGLPIIASDWKYNKFLICDYENGMIFNLDISNDLERCIEYLIDNKAIVLKMRDRCFEESKKYSPDIALRPLFENL